MSLIELMSQDWMDTCHVQFMTQRWIMVQMSAQVFIIVVGEVREVMASWVRQVVMLSSRVALLEALLKAFLIGFSEALAIA